MVVRPKKRGVGGQGVTVKRDIIATVTPVIIMSHNKLKLNKCGLVVIWLFTFDK